MATNNKILYFGYGANSRKKMMEVITGNRNLVGYPAILKGFILCIQRLDQIPDSVLSSSPAPISPRQLLKESWPDSFESYIIKSASKTDEVAGTIWELTFQERELVRDWELIDFGWYRDIKTKALTEDGREVEVETEGLRDGQEVDRVVDGKNYEPFINPLKDFQRVAEKARREYLERIQTKSP